MSLYHSVGEWVLQQLPHDMADAKVVAALKGKSAAELLVLYFNWQMRLIAQRPRKVMRSTTFASNSIVVERQETIAQIVADIENGSELTKFLSRRVRLGFTLPPTQNKKQLGKLQHLDLLFNDWGIHHLHISINIESDGFVERDDPLLFAIFRSSAAYFLDVGTHSSFADDRLVQIAVESWPDDRLFMDIKGVLGSRDRSYKSEERAQLRKAGLAMTIQIGDKVFMPPGISTAGTSIQASRQANQTLRTLNNFEDKISDDATHFIKFLKQNGGQPSDRPEFKFAIFDNGYGFIETTSGLPVLLAT